jgi:protein phosphatase
MAAMELVIRLPDPSLVVLIGPAGAGKTTLAGRLFDRGEVLSSDAFRERISGDAATQRVTKLAFSLLHQSLARRLAIGQLTVVDATNVESAARRVLIAQATPSSVQSVALVLDVPLELALARNAARPDRLVEPGIVIRHWRALARTLAVGSLAADGFDLVVRLTPGLIEALRIERVDGRRALEYPPAVEPISAG